MNEKYQSNTQFLVSRTKRAMIRLLLRPLQRWRPLDQPEPGYSVIIGCLSSMTKVLHANLTLLAKQDRTHLHEVVIVFDTTPNEQTRAAEAELRQRFDSLQLRFVYYSRLQDWFLKKLGSAWCYAWLSWCIGVAACRTRHALLHDLDALLLRPDILEQRYQAIRDRDDAFVGVRYYHGNGIGPEDCLAVTFEMMFDVQCLRQRYRPIDIFNRVDRHHGRRIEYDTFLHVQAREGRSSTLPVELEEMVHPSQLFCQYTSLVANPGYVPPERNNLPMLPYFFYLAGDRAVLDDHRMALEEAEGSIAHFFGRPMDLSRLSQTHLDWLIEQTRRVENAVAGEVRPEVEAYLQSLARIIERQGSGGPPAAGTPDSSHPTAQPMAAVSANGSSGG